MQMQHQIFYREMGVRRLSALLSPVLKRFKEFPRNAVYHHLTPGDDIQIDPSKAYFHEYQQKIPVDLVSTTSNAVGDPRPLPFVPRAVISPFIRDHHDQFKYVAGAAAELSDERTLSVLNYNALKLSYRFPVNVLSELNKWQTYHRALFGKIAELTSKSNKNHYVILNPIEDIPSLSTLQIVGVKEGAPIARMFNTSDRLMVLELFNFIRNETRDKSIFSLVPPKQLSKVNLIFLTKDGRASVLNLSYLYSWIKGNEDVSGTKIAVQFDDSSVYRSFIKYLLILSSSIPEEVSETVPLSQTSELEEDSDDRADNDYISNVSKPSLVLSVKTDKVQEETIGEVGGVGLLSSMDEDLAILEHLDRKKMKDQNIEVKDGAVNEVVHEEVEHTFDEVSTEIYTSLSPTEGLERKLKLSVESGNMTASSYKKALADSKKYQLMLDPYGSRNKVTDMVKIDPKDLEIKPTDIQMKDHATIFDKSMVSSSMTHYTSEYVDKHLKNDVVKMVGALQKGGVILQSHEVDVEHTVDGSVENHRIEIKPIDGVASSLWFKVPVIEEDGSYRVAGNRYMLKKQRVDLPIRKIETTKVALSSYYGKSFVETESKMADSVSSWVCKQIDKASFEGSEHITEIKPGNTFDSDVKTPYIFSVLSERYISMKAGDLQLQFNNDVSIKMKGPSEGSMFCGTKGKTNDPVFVTNDDTFFVLIKGVWMKLGDIFTILKLDPHDAPVRFTELAVFRKSVAVALVLGYRLGWSRLLTLLKVKPRFVEPKKRLNLLEDEYPIVFNDGTYIFSRKDRNATMILAGFMDYAKVTKQYSVRDFEAKGVYLNLMTSKGLSAIYIREIDMLFDYFVDPITEEVLIDMNEPTTFEGLLIRASEMLMTREHPKSQDGSNTRIRGYERISGAVYTQMTQSIRSFRSRNIAGRSRVEISPWAVWQNLSEDPTKFMIPEINPVQDLKNDEGVTYVGEGGRSKDAINKASRSFHKNDIGTISEATVDSRDVGVNIYTSADPVLKNLRGVSHKDAEITATNRHSSAVLLAPGAMHDD